MRHLLHMRLKSVQSKRLDPTVAEKLESPLGPEIAPPSLPLEGLDLGAQGFPSPLGFPVARLGTQLEDRDVEETV